MGVRLRILTDIAAATAALESIRGKVREMVHSVQLPAWAVDGLTKRTLSRTLGP